MPPPNEDRYLDTLKEIDAALCLPMAKFYFNNGRSLIVRNVHEFK